MQLPFANLLGLATGAVGLISKVLAGNSGNTGFEALLNAEIEGGAESGKAGLVTVLLEEGVLNEDALNELLGCASGITLVQLMSELEKIGVGISDIAALLSSDASTFSDDSLSRLLASFGIDGEELKDIMSDPKIKTGIITDLADSLKGVVAAQADIDGLDPEILVKLATADDLTIERLIAAAETKIHGKHSGADAFNKAIADLQKTSQDIMTALENAPSVTTLGAVSAREIIAKALKASGISVDRAECNNPVSQATASLVEKDVAVAGSVLGISREVLNDLFFGSDSLTRDSAVAQVTRQINAYLASNHGEQLQPEVMETLAFLKSAMSEQEFSGIENSLKLWNPNLAIPDARAEMDRNFYTALAKQLSGNDPAMVYDRQMNQVMDQIRRGLPSHIKNNEGSVTLKLYPPMLGRVDVNMSMINGHLEATFKADQMVTRDILFQNIHVLKESLAEQGIRVANVTITAGLGDRAGNEGYAFAGHDRQNKGFGRNDRQSGASGRSFREDDEHVYVQTIARQGSSASGLDIFA
ncbi:MAG TPA: flagellar hook-length control protein FliK [Deltaproteobacteria bacterium]|nr:flagellar hook-length control protein FliK [Deltaproteobacteria bacterium]